MDTCAYQDSKYYKTSHDESIPILPPEIIKLIFAFMSDIKIDRFNVMLTCRLFNDVGRQVFSSNVDVNVMMKKASVLGNTQCVRLLLTHRNTDPTFENNCAFFYAMHNGDFDTIIQLLNDSRVNPSICTLNPFSMIIGMKRNHKSCILKALLSDARIDPSQFNNIALRTALRVQDYETACEILSHEKVSQNIDVLSFLSSYDMPTDIMCSLVKCYIRSKYKTINTF